eukprot:UN23870
MSSASSTQGTTVDMQLHLGDVVVVPEGVGIIRYKGSIPTMGVETWLGVEIKEGKGNNDGTLNGTRYFECQKGRGVFLQLEKVKQRVSAEKLLGKMIELRQAVAFDRKFLKKQRGRVLRQASRLKQLKDSFGSFEGQIEQIETAISKAKELKPQNRRTVQYEIDQLKSSISHFQKDMGTWKNTASKDTELREFLELELNKEWFISKRDVYKRFKHVGGCTYRKNIRGI